MSGTPSPITVHYPLAEHTLDNGLRIVVNPDPIAPGVAVNLWYQVGSADELPGKTGFAHLFEHLMFTGTDEVAKGEHQSLIQDSGGSLNATTSFDRTNYFETVHLGALEMALWLEAQRMNGLAVTQAILDTEREVVKEEKRMRVDNVDYGDFSELILSLNFPEDHPYHHSVIGSMEDLNQATLDDVHHFYHSWYHPGNAIMALSGAIEADQAFELVEHYFGHLKAREMPPRVPLDPLPAHRNTPTLTVERDAEEPMTALTWRICPITHPDSDALLMGLEILGGSSLSRLRRLMHERDKNEIMSASTFGLARGTSLAVVSARFPQDLDMNEVRDVMMQEVINLATDGPTEAEVARVKAESAVHTCSRLASFDMRADTMNHFASHFGDVERLNTEMERIMALTPDDIRSAVSTWMSSDSAAVVNYEVIA